MLVSLKGKYRKGFLIVAWLVMPISVPCQSLSGSLAPSTNAELIPGSSNLSNIVPLLPKEVNDQLLTDPTGASTLGNVISLSPVTYVPRNDAQATDNDSATRRPSSFGVSNTDWRPQTGIQVAPSALFGSDKRTTQSKEASIQGSGEGNQSLQEKNIRTLGMYQVQQGMLPGNRGEGAQNHSASTRHHPVTAGGGMAATTIPGALVMSGFPDSTQNRGDLNPPFSGDSSLFKVGGEFRAKLGGFSDKTFLNPSLTTASGNKNVRRLAPETQGTQKMQRGLPRMARINEGMRRPGESLALTSDSRLYNSLSEGFLLRKRYGSQIAYRNRTKIHRTKISEGLSSTLR